MLPYCEQVNWEKAWCMSWSECCGCAMAFSAACQWHMMVQYCCDSDSINKLFLYASYFDRNPMKWFWMCGYITWLWKAQKYSSCIVLYPLQVGSHIMSRTKEQWVTVVNSWQANADTSVVVVVLVRNLLIEDAVQTTQFKVACPSNIGDMCIHSKMTV